MNIKHQNFKKSVHMEKCPFLLMETLLFMALFPSCFILERNTLILIGSEILLKRKLRWALLLFTYLRNVTIMFDPKYCRNVFRLVHVLARNVGSSYQSCSMKQVVLKDLAKFTEKHVSRGPFIIKLQTWGDSCVFGGIFMNIFFTEQKWHEFSYRNDWFLYET